MRPRFSSKHKTTDVEMKVIDFKEECPGPGVGGFHGATVVNLVVYTGPKSQQITLDHGRIRHREAGLGVKTEHSMCTFIHH